MCLVKDGDGRIALHYAAMRGHVAVAKLLVTAQRRSVLETVGEGGETVLHLCVEYNQLEVLKLLLSLLVNSPCLSQLLVNSKDTSHGITVLHLAVMLKQIETVKYLLSVPGLKQDTANHKGLRASELVEQYPQADFNSVKLKLIMANPRSDKAERSLQGGDDRDQPKLIIRWLNALHMTASQWLQTEQTRASIMVAAALITQTTFQTAFNPPGGVWQQTSTTELTCSLTHPCYAGTSILGSDGSGDCTDFIKFNSASFRSSLGVILLVVGGLPLTNKLCTWLMTVAMLVAITSMALGYLSGMGMVVPYDISHPAIFIITTSTYIGIALLAIIGIFHTVIVLIWLLKKSLRVSHLLGLR